MQRVDDATLWAFVSGDLSEELSRDIEAQLAENADLRSRFEEMETIVAGVEHWSHLKMRSRVQHVIQRENKRKIWRRGIYILVMVIVALVMYVLASLSISKNDVEPEELFASHFEPMSLPGLNRNAEMDGLKDSITWLYAYKEYGRVAAFDQDGLESELPDQALLSLGISLMEEGRYDRALVYFDQVVSTSGSLLADHAEWYMILSKMASGGPMDLSALSRIAQDTGHDRHLDAQSLLNATK